MQFLTEGEKLMKKAKIMIESHGVSPWHDYLQNMFECISLSKNTKINSDLLPSGCKIKYRD